MGVALVDRTLERVDTIQQRTRPTALAVAVFKRYSEDKASRQAALITFYGFLSVFPLMLLLVTFAALAIGESSLRKHLLDSALAQFPLIGDQLALNIHAIVAGNTLAFVAAALGLLWGSLGITNSLQSASAVVWRRPPHEDPWLGRRVAKGLTLLGILLAVTVLSSVVAGVAVNGVERVGLGGNLGQAIAYAGVLLANAAGYLVSLKLLAPPTTSYAQIVPGMALGAVGWTALQVLSGWLIGHRLHHASSLYGAFAVVLGLIFWINLGAQLFLYSSELNVVLARREWPRSMRSEPEV